jgi:hypothetical protein
MEAGLYSVNRRRCTTETSNEFTLRTHESNRRSDNFPVALYMGVQGLYLALNAAFLSHGDMRCGLPDTKFKLVELGTIRD